MAGAGIGVLLIVTVPVLFVVFDLDLDNIVPQADEPPFEIPFPIPPPDMPPDPDAPIIIEGDEGCVDGECIPIDNPDIPIVPPEVDEDVDNAKNTTETSTDPPPQQVCDELNLFCGTAKIIELQTNVVKIDSTLQRFNETFTSNIPLASLFVEDTSNIDFRNGFIEMTMLLKTDPNTQINADGTFNIKIGETEIFGTDAQLIANGVTDENGEIRLSFVPLPLEILSSDITFDFNAHFDKFPDEEITKVAFVVKTLSIDSGSEHKNGIINQEVFSMDIFKDPIQIFIEDSDGNQVRTYPQDDRLTISSNDSSLICKVKNVNKCSRCTAPSASVCAVYDAVALSKITVTDSDGHLVDAGQGTGTVIDVMLFRNSNYTVSTQFGDFEIQTPKSQKNYSYNVWTTQDKEFKHFSTTACSIYCMQWDREVPIGAEMIRHNFPIQ